MEPITKLNEYMLIHEAARFLGVTASTLRNWERNNKLAAHRNPHNSYRLYRKSDLEQLLKDVQQRQRIV